MADYTYKEIERMQNDAMKRVENMEKRARTIAGLDKNPETEPKKETKGTESTGINHQEPKHISMPLNYLDNLKVYSENQPKVSGKSEENKTKKSSSLPFLERITASLKDIKIDSDKALLLSLIMLLSEEKGDEILIMALIYMLS